MEQQSETQADTLRRAWAEEGWPADLFDRALAVGMSLRSLDVWLRLGERGLEAIRLRLPQMEELTFGTIRGREVSWADNDRFSDLWANAPEEVGDWEITVERGPNAFAQFLLQENVSIPVLEERGRLLACVVWSKQQRIVGGVRFTVHCGQGLRVRKDCRGKGYGNLVRAVPLPFWYPPVVGQYHYIRSQNEAAVSFFRHTSPVLVRETDAGGDAKVTVHQYPRQPFSGDTSGIRNAERRDLKRCVALINRTHRGQDLFPPYTAERLELRLDQHRYGRERQIWWEDIYGWDDYYVLEEDGRIVACAGLWDRGANIRERWRHKETGEERTMSVTALMDFGYQAGREAAMARLIANLIGETDRLGRDFLVAPLANLPGVARHLEDYAPLSETRTLGWVLWDTVNGDYAPAPPLRKPYTDLAYW